MYQEQDAKSRRRDAGVLQVTERDIVSLRWIAEQYCISFDHLQQLLGQYSPTSIKTPEKLSVGATRNAVERWLQLGYIETPRKVVRAFPTHIWLSRKGLREFELPFPYYVPNPTMIPHLYAVNAVRLFLQRCDLSAEWLAHRLLERETGIHPLPDAELQQQHIPLIAVQVIEIMNRPFISRETGKAFYSLVTRRRANTYFYEKVWYFLHASALQPMRDLLEEIDQEEKNRVIFYSFTMKELLAGEE